jgi:hypothetical protein
MILICSNCCVSTRFVQILTELKDHDHVSIYPRSGVTNLSSLADTVVDLELLWILEIRRRWTKSPFFLEISQVVEFPYLSNGGNVTWCKHPVTIFFYFIFFLFFVCLRWIYVYCKGNIQHLFCRNLSLYLYWFLTK